MPTLIEVEYCAPWGWEERFLELREEVLAKVPEAIVNGFEGRKYSFEVKINGELIFSKIDKGCCGFSDFKAIIVQVIQRASN